MPTMQITDAGTSAFAAATNASQLNLQEVRLGSGHNPTPATATALTAALANRTYRIQQVTQGLERYAVVSRLDANAISLQCIDRSDDAVAPTEIGLFTDGGTLVAYYSVSTGNIFNKAADSTWQFVVELAFSNLDTATISFTQNAILPATETRAGIAQVATQAETRAGTDDTKFVTPAKALDVIGQQSFQIHDLALENRVLPEDELAYGDVSETGEPNRKTTITQLFARVFARFANIDATAVRPNDDIPIWQSPAIKSLRVSHLVRLFRIASVPSGTPTLLDEIAYSDVSANNDAATGYKPTLRASLDDVMEVGVEAWARKDATAPIPAGRLQAYRQVYDTAGTYTWTKPTGFNFFRIQLWGGGGQGIQNHNGRSGGGGGAYLSMIIPTEHLMATEEVVVGATPAPVQGATTAQNGGDSEFKGISARGGGGGDFINRLALRPNVYLGSGGAERASLPPEANQEAGQRGNSVLAYYAGQYGADAESLYGYSYGNGSGYLTDTLANASAPNNGSDGAVIITAF